MFEKAPFFKIKHKSHPSFTINNLAEKNIRRKSKKTQETFEPKIVSIVF